MIVPFAFGLYMVFPKAITHTTFSINVLMRSTESAGGFNSQPTSTIEDDWPTKLDIPLGHHRYLKLSIVSCLLFALQFRARTGQCTIDFVISDEEPCLFKVGEAMLAGEIEYRKGNFDAAFETLREAVRYVRKELQLEETEPTWHFPSSHSRMTHYGSFSWAVCLRI